MPTLPTALPTLSPTSRSLPRLTRRRFLGHGAAGAAGVLLGTGAWQPGAAATTTTRTNPFTLGVGSGDPTPDGVVLWSRLATDPLAADGRGGMPDHPVPVRYEVATDEHFRRVATRGSVLATPALGHSVHPEVRGLRPDRVYWYRFRARHHLSPTGRTRTSPAHHASPASLRFAFASCQAWQDGYFTAYDHLAEEDLDLVVHLGDYVYEQALTTNKRGVALAPAFDTPMTDLAGYRLRYALYRSEPPLQRASAAFPWVHTFDDHEVQDNWAGDVPRLYTGRPVVTAADFRHQRAMAFQAMYENEPLRRAQLPDGPDIRIHRRIPYGRLAELTMLDSRQYRDDQPCGDGESSTCTERFAAGRTMLGGRQREWLLDGLRRSPARWQILGNQAPMGLTDADPDPEVEHVFLDPWDGYVAERNTLLGDARLRGADNLVVITGDRHQNYAGDLVTDFEDPDAPVVGTEFVGTSITSGGDGVDQSAEGDSFLAASPHLRFFNGQRGYSRVEVTPSAWHHDFRVVAYVLQPGAPVSTRASFTVESGRPGVAAP